MTEEERRQRAKALRGKYRSVNTSSEDFAARKQEEIALEDARPTTPCPACGGTGRLTPPPLPEVSRLDCVDEFAGSKEICVKCAGGGRVVCT